LFKKFKGCKFTGVFTISMRQTFIIPVVLAALLCAGAEPHKLVRTKITPQITVSLPTVMFPMTPEDLAQRFPSVRAPLGAYTNEARMVDFSVSTSATQWDEKDMPLAQKFFKAGITNLYDRVDYISEGIATWHKRDFIFFEFNSRVHGDKRALGSADPILKYHFVAYHIRNNRTLVFSFSCPRALQAEWQETAHAMFKTIHVR
jgi:hypothetical protein